MNRATAGRLSFVGGSLAFFLVTAWFAHNKLFWIDELFTLYIARQPDWRRFVAAVLDGGDTLPPAIHVITRASILVLGEHPLAVRLPSIFGFWMLLICVYAFVRHRCSAFAAWSSAVVPLTTNTYWYAFEARPYGLFAGFTALTLLAWQRADGPRRGRWLAVMGAALWVGLLLHWYAVLLLPIIGVAEWIRQHESRRRQPGVYAALAAAGVAAAPLLYPFIVHGLRFTGLLAPSPPAAFVDDAYALLIGGLVPFLLPLLAVAVCSPARENGAPRPMTNELVLAFGLATLPLMAAVLAGLTRTQLVPRYVIGGVAGCAILIGFVAEYAIGGHPRRKAMWSATLTMALLTNLVVEKLWLPERSAVARGKGEFALLTLMDGLNATEPVVVGDGLAFLQLAYYAPPRLADRLVHAADDRSLTSRALIELAGHAPIRVERTSAVVGAGGMFYLYDVGFDSPPLASIAQNRVTIEPVAGIVESATPYGKLYHVRVVPLAPSPTP